MCASRTIWTRHPWRTRIYKAIEEGKLDEIAFGIAARRAEELKRETLRPHDDDNYDARYIRRVQWFVKGSSQPFPSFQCDCLQDKQVS
jgi:hypothetical protein